MYPTTPLRQCYNVELILPNRFDMIKKTLTKKIFLLVSIGAGLVLLFLISICIWIASKEIIHGHDFPTPPRFSMHKYSEKLLIIERQTPPQTNKKKESILKQADDLSYTLLINDQHVTSKFRDNIEFNQTDIYTLEQKKIIKDYLIKNKDKTKSLDNYFNKLSCASLEQEQRRILDYIVWSLLNLHYEIEKINEVIKGHEKLANKLSSLLECYNDKNIFKWQSNSFGLTSILVEYVTPLKLIYQSAKYQKIKIKTKFSKKLFKEALLNATLVEFVGFKKAVEKDIKKSFPYSRGPDPLLSTTQGQLPGAIRYDLLVYSIERRLAEQLNVIESLEQNTCCSVFDQYEQENANIIKKFKQTSNFEKMVHGMLFSAIGKYDDLYPNYDWGIKENAVRYNDWIARVSLVKSSITNDEIFKEIKELFNALNDIQ